MAREMKMTLRALSALLSYPSAELAEHAHDVREAVRNEGALPPAALAGLDVTDAREMLEQPAHVFAALAERLTKRETPYAGIFQALVVLAGGKPDVDALQEIQEREPVEDPALLDEEWEEAPVTFNAAATHEMGGPTGFVAKVRASNRPVSKEAGR